MDIPMNVKVFCKDGEYGRSSRVILNPQTKKISQLVVKEKNKPQKERIFPIMLIREASPFEIQLECTLAQTSKMATFMAVEYVKESGPQYSDSDLKIWPYEPSTPIYRQKERYIKVQYERLAPGELALQKGARVKAKDGFIGHVQEFLVNPMDGNITHLVLREGHFWGQKDVSIKMSHVERIEEKIIYLNLEKSAIEKLPGAKVRKREKQLSDV